MPEEEPVCDCEEGELPDPDPGCCGSTVCEETETCCNETTCVLTSSFQTDTNNCGGCGNVCPPGQTCVAGVCTGEEITCPPGYVSCGATGGTFIVDSDVEWTWVNDNGCPEGCQAFKAEQPTAEEEAAGVAPGDFSYDGICCEPAPGCCYTAVCAYNSPSTPGEEYNYEIVSYTPSSIDCSTAVPNECAGEGQEPGQQGSYGEALCNEGCVGDIIYIWSAEPCIGGLSVPSDKPVEVTESPCSQEECEAHVSTWMAEPSGEPNEEGLYKVKWILLDGCPGLCCSDQPTQPEFVKSSTLVDAPCKCGCN